jgi:hypothetical protein
VFCINWFVSIGVRARLIVFYSNHRSMPITMSFQKMQSEFFAWKEKINKMMEEHMRKLESFSPPCLSPASRSLPKMLTPPAATITKKKKKRKKRTVEATKISKLTFNQTIVDQPSCCPPQLPIQKATNPNFQMHRPCQPSLLSIHRRERTAPKAQKLL